MKKIIILLLSIFTLLILSMPVGAEELPTSYSVLFSGIDNRGPLIPESRSDANVIITVNTETKQILLVHIPRDYDIEFAGMGGVSDKLCNCGMYGVNTLLATVNQLMGMDMQYYIRFNFQGFIDFIDAMGGIDVYSEYEVYTWNQPGAHLNKGMNHIDGTSALAYGRERYSFNTGDFQRGRNQEWLIKGGIEAFTTGAVLDNFQSFLDATVGCYETNVPMSYVVDMLVKQQSDRSTWNVVMYDLTGESTSVENKYKMIPNTETVEYARTLIQKLVDGETLNQDEIPYTIGETHSYNLSDPELNKVVQEKLNELGYSCGETDGIIGDQTKRAISQYRTDKGLTPGEKIDRELTNNMGIEIPPLE